MQHGIIMAYPGVIHSLGTPPSAKLQDGLKITSGQEVIDAT